MYKKISAEILVFAILIFSATSAEIDTDKISETIERKIKRRAENL